jgi:hypothetical protein
VALWPCVVAAALLLAPGCRTLAPAPPPEDVPAVIVNPTEESRAALREAVSAALGGAQVRLADDALLLDSLLIIERARRRDPSGLPLDSRDPGTAERFRLVKRGGECVLVHVRTGQAYSLAGTECAEASPQAP